MIAYVGKRILKENIIKLLELQQRSFMSLDIKFYVFS